MGIRIAVLASGRGSNLLAIMDSIAAGKIDGEIAVVLSDKAEAKALDHAKNAGIPAYHVNPKAYEQKADYEAELLKHIKEADCQLICLAGYMRILSPYFIGNAPCPVMNIHPALLPSFPGLHGQRQALEYGVKVAGCTVHFVDEGMDSGAIILQKVCTFLFGTIQSRKLFRYWMMIPKIPYRHVFWCRNIRHIPKPFSYSQKENWKYADAW